jgi:hypothetical protein
MIYSEICDHLLLSGTFNWFQKIYFWSMVLNVEEIKCCVWSYAQGHF